jgi:hypothetical protein
MTPKERAIYLVDMFMEHTVEWDQVTEVAFDSEYRAKQCALIAVETVQNLCWGNNQVGIEHWKQVKQEIEQL